MPLPAKKTYHCPAFADSAVTHWFPYYTGQQVTFVTAGGTQAVLHIGMVWKTPAYDTSVTLNFSPGVHAFDCVATDSILSAEVDTNQHHLLLLQCYQHDTVATLSSLSLTLKGGNFYGYGINNNGLTGDAYAHAQYDTLQHFVLPGHTWSLVQRIQLLDTAGLQVGAPYKLYIAPGNGVVGYELYPSHQVWGLQ